MKREVLEADGHLTLVEVENYDRPPRYIALRYTSEHCKQEIVKYFIRSTTLELDGKDFLRWTEYTETPYNPSRVVENIIEMQYTVDTVKGIWSDDK